ANQPIDDGPLNPKCEKPKDCPGDFKTVFYYDPKKGCQLIKLGENCTDNGNYRTLEDCNRNCLPAPGKLYRFSNRPAL
ncbi:Salp10, putative, partial [Ixodes scapularis]